MGRRKTDHRAKFHRAPPNDVQEKRYNFFTPFSTLTAQGDPLYKSSPILAMMHSKAPSTNLPNFVDFVDGVTDKNSKRYVSAIRIPCGDSNLTKSVVPC